MFFDYYAFTEGSLRNVTKGGSIAGFELKTKITYYRGVPLSMVAGLDVTVDGKRVPPEDISFSVDGDRYYTLAEMKLETKVKWEFGEEATIFVAKEGGLAPGEHKVGVRTTITVAYAPVNFMGERTRMVQIGSIYSA